ncbi:hypothetical protein L9F63_001570, partial [Diploptera punctata]
EGARRALFDEEHENYTKELNIKKLRAMYLEINPGNPKITSHEAPQPVLHRRFKKNCEKSARF